MGCAPTPIQSVASLFAMLRLTAPTAFPVPRGSFAGAPRDRRPILRDGSRKAVRFKAHPALRRFAPGMPLPSVGRAFRPSDPRALLRSWRAGR